MNYPAVRPDVLAVGGVNNNQSLSMSPMAYATSVFDDANTSAGPLLIHYAWIGDELSSGIDLAAPRCVRGMADAAPATYLEPTAVEEQRCGTSFAAPQVAAAAGMLRHALGVTEPRRLHTNLLLLGDSNGSVAGERTTGLSSETGNGRLRIQAPQTLVSPAEWLSSSILVNAAGTFKSVVGGSASAEPSSIQQLKWVAAHYPTDPLSISVRFNIELWDTCAPNGKGGTTSVRVAQDVSGDLVKRIDLKQPDLCPAGRPTCRCLEKRIVVTNNASFTSNRIFSAHYFHSGPVEVPRRTVS